jgi:hypothetical protein
MSLAAVKVTEAVGLSDVLPQNSSPASRGHGAVRTKRQGSGHFVANEVMRAITTRSSQDSETSVLISEHDHGRITG